ncbi:MAG: orotidine-5'-phosphate decarboxylase [Myxococcota bacterium]
MSTVFDPGNRLIVAMDLPARADADALIERLGSSVAWLKIGLELFLAEGPDIVSTYVKRGYRIMLDLKLHDIPATVEHAAARVAALGASLLTVHAAGGRAMLESAVRGAGSSLRVLPVTALTSLDQVDLAEVGVAEDLDRLVVRRAELAAATGCHGVVASPREAADIRAAVGESFLIVCPGVRPAGADAGDQKRHATPAAARSAGADLIVCGRPIRNADDPAAAARAIVAELNAAEAGA